MTAPMTPSSVALPLVYGSLPWLVPEDLPAVKAFFVECGTPVHFKHGEKLPFGYQTRLYFIETGLIATLPVRDGDMTRVCGLFGANTTLGLVMAMRARNASRNAAMTLSAQALGATTALRVELGQFDAWLARVDASQREDIYRNCIAKVECQLEGVFLNDTYSVTTRLLWALYVLFEAHKGPPSERAGLSVLPWPITISELSQLIHSTREMTSRAFSEAMKAGICVKEGRRILVHRPALAQALQTMEHTV